MLLSKTIVSLVLVMFLVLPRAYAQTLSSADFLAIFDSTGKRIGSLQGIDDSKTHVVLRMDGLLISLDMERDRFRGDGSLSFVSADCSGQPLLGDDDKLFPTTYVIGSTGTLFVADRSVPPQTLVINSSTFDFEGSCRADDFPRERNVLPALEFPNLLAQFTPPFRVQAEQTPGGGSGLAGPPNFPALIRGAGSSTQVVVGAGATALSVDSSFRATDGSLLEMQSVEVPPNGASAMTFEGGDLEFGSLALAVEPPNAHVLSTEVISLVGASSLGVLPSPLCTNPEFLMVESSGSHTAAAFSNPSSEDTASCDWEVFAGDGVSVGGGNFEVPPLGQLQFFPVQRIVLPGDFLGSFKAACDAAVHIFSLFQKSDLSLTLNAAGCGEQ